MVPAGQAVRQGGRRLVQRAALFGTASDTVLALPATAGRAVTLTSATKTCNGQARTARARMSA
ncbi:hypothetical protein Srubr_30190 [Streptomyces rubradiris]|uniref:Uncharacterized protein n=1 Tax=Streptomyces rubradiris TaxID=285531 RepID=A0ABQ3RBF1_STRRR|nr:hypothetical protein GCM10018792_70600 [Streptomyces rubradiris]GHI53173.1 hypothetical protein Srubr_30190 [Streptomyces rubradiris]